eukprot:gene8100-8938_t
MTSSSQPHPIITLDFQFPNEQPHCFYVINPPPINVNQVHPDAKTSNTSYGYSGRHDHGALPTLKSEGAMASVVSALAQAKEMSDHFLTARINDHYGYNNNASHAAGAASSSPSPVDLVHKPAAAAAIDIEEEEEEGVDHPDGMRVSKKKRLEEANASLMQLAHAALGES